MKRIKDYIPLSAEEVESSKNEIEYNYSKFLAEKGIKRLGNASNSYYQLIYLNHFRGFAVSKEAITAFVKQMNPEASGDQQVRHLGSQKGYCIFNKGEEVSGEKIPSGYYCLTSLCETKPSWEVKKEARIEKCSSFEEVKQKYNYCCATCGAKEDEPHRFTLKKVRLQQGHINPNLPLTIENTIPQCEWCNQNVYKDDFVFTAEGRPQKINNANYILKSDEVVQRKMYELLKRKYG